MCIFYVKVKCNLNNAQYIYNKNDKMQCKKAVYIRTICSPMPEIGY